jgi:hypothetical protein
MLNIELHEPGSYILTSTFYILDSLLNIPGLSRLVNQAKLAIFKTKGGT